MTRAENNGTGEGIWQRGEGTALARFSVKQQEMLSKLRRRYSHVPAWGRGVNIDSRVVARS
jgi:hypothetical protein